MAPQVRKYAFDTVFDAGGTVVRETQRDRPRHTDADLEAARAAALAAGRADAQAAAEAETAKALLAVGQEIAALRARLEAALEPVRADAAALALALARKAAGRALEQNGEALLEHACARVLDQIGAAPRLVVQAPAGVLERARESLATAAEAHGFPGALVLQPAPAGVSAFASFVWADGAMRYDLEALFAQLEEAVQDQLNAPTGAAP